MSKTKEIFDAIKEGRNEDAIALTQDAIREQALVLIEEQRTKVAESFGFSEKKKYTKEDEDEKESDDEKEELEEDEKVLKAKGSGEGDEGDKDPEADEAGDEDE